MKKQNNVFKTTVSKIKFKSFSFFLLLAFVFLIFTKLSKKYTETLNLKVELVNVPDDIYINQDSISPILVSINTIGYNQLIQLFKSQSLILDFQNVFSKDGNRAFSTSQNVKSFIAQKLSYHTMIESVKPDTLSIPFSKLISKKVPIKLNSEMKFLSGYKLYDSIAISPDSVTIIGAFKAIEQVSFVETNLIYLQEIKSNINEKVDLKFNPSSQIKLSQYQVNVSANVEKFTENVVTVPIDISGVPNHLKINYFPKTAEVFYEVALKDAVRIQPEMFEVVCDYTQVNNKNVVTLKPIILKYPGFVRNPKLKLTEVEFIITQ